LFSVRRSNSFDIMEWLVIVFLSPVCPICQDYTYFLNELHADWTDREWPVEMIGVFPNVRVTEAQIQDFARKYEVDWPLRQDTCGWSERLEAQWTPECAIIEQATGDVMYQGRVNDLYFALGKHRAQPKSADLADALEALLAGKLPREKRNTPIGCPIENAYPNRNCSWNESIKAAE